MTTQSVAETVKQSITLDMARALIEAAPDIGLTCGEAEKIAHGLAAIGHRDEAIAFLVGHGESESEDPDEDEHAGIDSTRAAAIVDALTA